MSSSKASKETLSAAYKPQILKIKINHFRSWIERRLTQLLEGMEDEILWSLVFNYLEEAQKRAKKEGPAANPSGGLKADEIQTALSGFLGQKPATNFVNELFTLLKEAEESETGIPAEFGMKPEEAVKEAFGIIGDKRKEMELSQRVRREVSRNDRYNKVEYEYKELRDHSDSVRSRGHERSHSRRHSRSRSHDRYRHHHEHRIDHRDERRSDRYHHDRDRDDRSRHGDRDRSREVRVDRDDDRGRERGYHRDRESGRVRDYSRDRESGRVRDYSRDREHTRRHSRSRSRSRRPGHRETTDHFDRHRAPKSPIPSSSSSASPSPCWESSLETALPAVPRAPVAQENVPNALEQALRAKALQASANKKMSKNE